MKLNTHLSLQLSNSTSGYSPGRNKTLHLHEHLYMHVYSNFICNHQRQDIIQMSLDEGTDKLRCIHRVEHYTAMKRSEQLIPMTTMADPQGTVLSAKSPSQDFPGGPVVKILYPQCKGPRFNPWSESQIPSAHLRV